MGHRRIRLAGVAYLLCHERERPPRAGRRLSTAQLRGLLLAHRSNLALRSLLAEFDDRPLERRRHNGRHPATPDIAEFAERLRGYELTTPPPRLAAVIPPPYEFPEPEPSVLAPMFDEQRHWIEVCIVGENDDALPGIMCEITLPSGKVVRRRSDRHGLVRIEGITTPGACSLCLPDHHQNAWEPA